MTTIPATMVQIDSAGHWLNRDAAASLTRATQHGCPTEITSAGRTVTEQLHLIALHTADPIRHAYAAPISGPSSSEHITGNALDVGPSMGAWLVTHPGFGWLRTALPTEPWHWAYRASQDRYQSPVTSPVTIKPAVIPDEEHTMKDYVIALYVLLLGRMPDPTGLADAVYQLVTGKKTPAQVEADIRGSDEFRNLDPTVRVARRQALNIW